MDIFYSQIENGPSSSGARQHRARRTPAYKRMPTYFYAYAAKKTMMGNETNFGAFVEKRPSVQTIYKISRWTITLYVYMVGLRAHIINIISRLSSSITFAARLTCGCGKWSTIYRGTPAVGLRSRTYTGARWFELLSKFGFGLLYVIITLRVARFRFVGTE